MTDSINEHRAAISFGALLVLFAWESAAPFYNFFRSRLTDRLRHDGINLFLGIINAVFNATAAVALWYWTCTWAANNGIGILNWLDLPAVGEWLTAILLLDLWMYWWHRICHEVPCLWRFHRVHHSDPNMDVSTSYRFHLGEMMASAMARVPVIALVGLKLEHIALFELVMFVSVLLQHANISLSPTLDRLLRSVLVTPFMHKVHHSNEMIETNSNYCSLFSWCDRIFGTYRGKEDYHAIEFGLREFTEAKDQRLGALITNPLESRNTVASPGESVNSPAHQKQDT